MIINEYYSINKIYIQMYTIFITNIKIFNQNKKKYISRKVFIKKKLENIYRYYKIIQKLKNIVSVSKIR